MQTRRNPIVEKPDTQVTWNLGMTKHIDLPPEFNYKNASVIDPAFDADDEPDIHEMFRQFNERFFSNNIKGYSLWRTKSRKGDYAQTEFYTKKIILCGALIGQARSVLVKTLLHKMAHAALDIRGVCRILKAMCHTDVVAPIVTNRFPYFRQTSSFIDSKQSGLLLS